MSLFDALGHPLALPSATYSLSKLLLAHKYNAGYVHRRERSMACVYLRLTSVCGTHIPVLERVHQSTRPRRLSE
jgi:hypothetical protein